MRLPATEHVPAALPGRTPAAFLIAIDTEGDNIWAKPRAATTRNARYLPRFQALCERFELQPTYLTNFEMVNDAAFCEFATDALARGTAEIGMHMHAWDTPPFEPLSDRDWFYQPYAFEYSDELIALKAERVTKLLQDRFSIQITSHRAGRFGLSAEYARTLVKLGFRVDCSVTPYVDWCAHRGAPGGSGGPDFRSCPTEAYFLDPYDIMKPGDGPLLELPMTIIKGRRSFPRALARGLLGRRGPKLMWLRPDGTNLRDMLAILDAAERDNRQYVQFTLHSSEFMPDGSPTFRTPESIERLYRHMEVLFEAACGRFVGRTLTAFCDDISQTGALTS